MQDLGDRYRLDREQLAEAFEGKLQQLHPETREAVLTNLRDIQRALAEINLALDADPNNVLLQQLLVATYQEELAVFDQVNRIVAGSPRRSDSI
jgi:Tfp pilus assembly protein PilF